MLPSMINYPLNFKEISKKYLHYKNLFLISIIGIYFLLVKELSLFLLFYFIFYLYFLILDQTLIHQLFFQKFFPNSLIHFDYIINQINFITISSLYDNLMTILFLLKIHKIFKNYFVLLTLNYNFK